MNFNDVVDLNGYNITLGGFSLLIILAIWELVWKGLALWRAAQNRETGWFVAILVLNTIGILPILYLYVFSKKSN
jgi:hypothetical protein